MTSCTGLFLCKVIFVDIYLEKEVVLFTYIYGNSTLCRVQARYFFLKCYTVLDLQPSVMMATPAASVALAKCRQRATAFLM